MYFLVVNLLLIGISLIFSLPINAQEIRFSVINNTISSKKINKFHSSFSSEQSSNKFSDKNILEEGQNVQDKFYLMNQKKKFWLREFFDVNQNVKVDDYYLLSLPKEDSLYAISFEYLLDSNEDLLHFDEPVFYIVLKKGSQSELIFAKTIEESGFSWNKVVLDLKNYDTYGADLFFYVGNLGDEEKTSTIYLKNLSSQIIILEPDDYLLIGDQEVKNLDEYIEKKFINFFDQTWPIYTFSSHLISDLMVVREKDNSLTLFFSNPKEKFFRNYLWKLSCGEEFEQFISQDNFYLFPNLIIRDFWPNLTEKVLLNIDNFVCFDLDLLILERF